MAGNRRKRSADVKVLKGVLRAVREFRSPRGPSFNDLLGRLRSEGVVSNHRSLRKYLDLLMASKALRMTSSPSAPNVRPRQSYGLTGVGPLVEVGEGALRFHGLGWDLGEAGTREAKVGLEGVARGTLASGTLYGSVEDSVVESIAVAKGREEKALALTFSAALLSSSRIDEAYLLGRAKDEGVRAEVAELLTELRALFYSPRVQVRDIRALYKVRQAGPVLRRGGGRELPRWTLFSPEGLLEVVAKQLGVK